MKFSITWSDTAQAKVKLLESQFANWESIRVGLEWGLQRKPWIREKIPGTSLRVWTLGPMFTTEGDSYFGKFFYELNEKIVTISWIEVFPEEF